MGNYSSREAQLAAEINNLFKKNGCPDKAHILSINRKLKELKTINNIYSSVTNQINSLSQNFTKKSPQQRRESLDGIYKNWQDLLAAQLEAQLEAVQESIT